MATTGVYVARSFEAGEDLSAAKWHFVTLESDGQVDVADADAEACLGVAMTNPDTAGQAVTVALSGVVKLVAGGTIAAGDDIVCDTNGHAVERSTSTSATAVTMGRALKSAVANDVFEAMIFQGGKITNEV